MNAIIDWFKTQDYDAGVALYAALPKFDARTLKSLQRGKSDRNMSLLIRELRKHRNAQKSAPATRPNRFSKPVRSHEPPVSSQTHNPQEQERKAVVEKSASSYFQKVKYAELPSELKLRFRQLKDIFYDMCDLKFALNDLPESAEEKALELQLQIEALDEQRTQIWKELDHWKKHKTLLPSDTSEDFSKLTPQQLYLKKANLASSISKIKKRLTEREEKITKEPDKEICQRLTEQNNRSRKKLHQHEINLRKIELLLL